MLDVIDFYSSYQSDYYAYKLMMLHTILKNHDSFKNNFLDGKLDGYVSEDFIRVLKSEIRQSYFHITETLFELILALLPENGVPSDKDVFLKLSTSDWRNNYSKILRIAKDQDGLNFLNAEIEVNEISNPTSIARYLFYFGVVADRIPKEFAEAIDPSISAIKLGLQIIATDFSNREEYNSYKHSLRIIPASKRFQLMNKVDSKVLLDIDLKDSMTYLTHDKKTNELTLSTKLFDSERDYQLILFCTSIIHNIIQLRKGALSKIKVEGQFPIHFFGEDEVKKMSKRNVVGDFQYKANFK